MWMKQPELANEVQYYEHSNFSGYEEWEDCTAGFRGET